MNRLESSTPAENAPFVQRHLPDIDGLPEGHPVRMLWKAKLEQGETVDAVIEHEVSEPQEAARQIELIDQVANGYEISIV